MAITPRTSAWGSFFDQNVPMTVKWGYQAEHINNMRYKYPPHHAYNTLLKLCKGKDYFVLTSNVDGCFERSGFDKDRIYTPQGDWKFLQCLEPCSREVFDSLPIIEKLLPSIKNCEITDPSQIPHCPKCGGTLFGNVRGGDWYIHDPYTPAQNRLLAWVTHLQAQGKRLTVLEIGAGWNTPIVTRWPMEAIVRDTPHATLVRVNPAHPGCPYDIHAVGLPCGTEVLTTLKNLGETPWGVLEEAEKRVEGEREKNKGEWDQRQHPKVNWKAVLQQLSRE